MEKDELQLIRDEIKDLKHKIKSLELSKLSISSLENSSVDYKKTPQINGSNILDENSASNLGAYCTAHISSDEYTNEGNNLNFTVTGGVNFSKNISYSGGEFTVLQEGIYYINIFLNINLDSSSNDTYIYFGNQNYRIISTSGAIKNANVSFTVLLNENDKIYVKSITGNLSVAKASISIIRIDKIITPL